MCTRILTTLYDGRFGNRAYHPNIPRSLNFFPMHDESAYLSRILPDYEIGEWPSIVRSMHYLRAHGSEVSQFVTFMLCSTGSE